MTSIQILEKIQKIKRDNIVLSVENKLEIQRLQQESDKYAYKTNNY